MAVARDSGRELSEVISLRSGATTLCIVLLGFSPVARAGDAVAIGYNADGVWTAVTYYCSSTPKGGADYKDEAGAREAAVRDLQSRAGEGIVKTAIIASSDRTGHFAYARGKRRLEQASSSNVSANRGDVHAVGYGPTKAAAEQGALVELRRQGGTGEGKVSYRYFSHGAQPPATGSSKSPATPRERR